MKPVFIIITVILSLVACNSFNENNTDCLISKLNVRSDYAGINTQKDYSISYDKQDRLKQILYQEIGYDDTIIVNYSVDYGCNGLPSIVYRQNLKSFGGIDSVPRISIEFEYENDTLKSAIYDMVVLGDITYQGGKLKSLVYQYFDYNADRSKFIDTSKTRKLSIETDSRGNITKAFEKPLGNMYNDVILTYESMQNPFYLNVLSLIPEPDFLAFFSKNNWTKMITNDDSCKIIQSRSFTYNKLKYPTRIRTKHEFDYLTIDSIAYN